MQIVIDIPEEDYAAILANADIVNKRKKHTLEEAVINGIPLPKMFEEIKAECIRAVDRIPITFSKQEADNCLKRDIRDIFDKYISGKEQE